MSIDLVVQAARRTNTDLLTFLELVDQNPEEFPVEIRNAVKDFIHRGNKMFAPVGLTEAQYEARADRRVAHFDV